MTESNTEHMDYFPPDWSEVTHAKTGPITSGLIQWVYNPDESIHINMRPVDQPDGKEYLVRAQSGYNNKGEAFTTTSERFETVEEALDVVQMLIYGMNGSIKRTEGDPEFNQDDSQ